MRSTLLMIVCGALSFIACQNNSASRLLNKADLSDTIQKNTEELKTIYSNMEAGFKVNNFTPYYGYLDEQVIVIDGQGEEIYGKEKVMEHFEHQLKEMDFELLVLNIQELKVSEDLALGTSNYTARFYNEKIDQQASFNWHLVWKKNAQGKWKIYREIYNQKK